MENDKDGFQMHYLTDPGIRIRRGKIKIPRKLKKKYKKERDKRFDDWAKNAPIGSKITIRTPTKEITITKTEHGK